MGGLFGIGGKKPAPAPVMPDTSKEQEKKKKQSDLERLARQRSYGQTQVSKPDNLLTGDTTLSSGSLLSLGGKLGG